MFQHAAEYVATEIGLNGSLRDVFDYFNEIGFDKELAWQRAIRHKFGFIQTNKPGDIMKPSMYYYNRQKVGQLSDGERLRLMVGKISIEDLDMHNSYKGRFPAEKVIKFFKLNI